ncbi:MAG TPA: hypothetical protein VFA48_12255 [Gammaproteobacteria bacterium]|nr:hypothetical protein [Gammaproteobacteria bacterium]
MKEFLRVWLEGKGWYRPRRRGSGRGVDIDAPARGAALDYRGQGYRLARRMRMNHFLNALDETLKRTDCPQAA